MNYKKDTVTDMDGNVYHTIAIGTQIWMVENLKTTRYCNGDAIQEITGNKALGNLTQGAYCNYGNKSNNADTYGRLYNWNAVKDSREIAPPGWHVATDEEWETLITHLGAKEEVGGKLKEADTKHWESPNKDATNNTGFTALPGGYRKHSGTFCGIGNYGGWWSSSESKAANAWGRLMYYYNSAVYRVNYAKKSGFSVRCVKD
jgi:uncharacterized protein (TIGR02145 family)